MPDGETGRRSDWIVCRPGAQLGAQFEVCPPGADSHPETSPAADSRRREQYADEVDAEPPQAISSSSCMPSATLPAAVPARRADGIHLELRLSTPAPGRDPGTHWIVELRHGDDPFGAVTAGDELALPGGATARIVAAYAAPRSGSHDSTLQQAAATYLAEHGHPVRYRHAPQRWPRPHTRPSTPQSPGAPRCPARGCSNVVTARPGFRWRRTRAAARGWGLEMQAASGSGPVPACISGPSPGSCTCSTPPEAGSLR